MIPFFSALAKGHPLGFALALAAFFVLGAVLVTAGLRRLSAARDRADQMAAREERLRAVWSRRALAMGIQPRDDESVDELMNRVVEAQTRASTTSHHDQHARPR